MWTVGLPSVRMSFQEQARKEKHIEGPLLAVIMRRGSTTGARDLLDRSTPQLPRPLLLLLLLPVFSVLVVLVLCVVWKQRPRRQEKQSKGAKQPRKSIGSPFPFINHPHSIRPLPHIHAPSRLQDDGITLGALLCRGRWRERSLLSLCWSQALRLLPSSATPPSAAHHSTSKPSPHPRTTHTPCTLTHTGKESRKSKSRRNRSSFSLRLLLTDSAFTAQKH